MSIRPPTTDLDAENEATLAQRALDEGNAERALHHAALALSRDPTHAARRALLDVAISRIPDPLAATELPVEPSYIEVATRAYVFASRAQWIEALALVSQAVKTRPDTPYLSWSLSWLQTPGVAAGLDDRAIFRRILAPLVSGLPKRVPVAPTHALRRNAQLARAIAAVLSSVHPTRANIAYAESALCRKLAAHEDAIRAAYRAHAIEPSFLTCIGRAAALRDAGNIEAACTAYEDAARYDPKDESVWIDIGDMLIGAARFGEAVHAFEYAIERAPENHHAEASLYYARFRANGALQDRAALARLRDLRPADDRLRRLADEASPPLYYKDVLPLPTDGSRRALGVALTSFREHPDRAPGARVVVSTTYPESPSAIVAFRLATSDVSPAPEVLLRVARVQYPDPRVARSKVDFALFAYDEMIARVIAPAPDPRVAHAVAQIARTRFDIDAWLERAAALGAEMGPAWALELACTMAHPPPIEGGRDPFDWVYRVQVAAALVLARIEKGWENTEKKRVLCTLCRGPVDWATAASVVALGVIAARDNDPDARGAVLRLFSDLRAEVSTSGYTAYELPLACVWSALPDLSEVSRRELSAWRTNALLRHFDEPADADPPAPSEPSMVDSREVESLDELGPTSDVPTQRRF